MKTALDDLNIFNFIRFTISISNKVLIGDETCKSYMSSLNRTYIYHEAIQNIASYRPDLLLTKRQTFILKFHQTRVRYRDKLKKFINKRVD